MSDEDFSMADGTEWKSWTEHEIEKFQKHIDALNKSFEEMKKFMRSEKYIGAENCGQYKFYSELRIAGTCVADCSEWWDKWHTQRYGWTNDELLKAQKSAGDRFRHHCIYNEIVAKESYEPEQYRNWR